jgi:1,2-diacylglycerol 3-beta-glucosyltransferase
MILSWFAVLVLLILDFAVLPYFLFLLATALAAIYRHDRQSVVGEPQSKILIVVPAHDEEPGIATTVHSCRASNYPADLFEVLVIADNCTDRTASIACSAGARVVERIDLVKKSKGFAIEYLIGSLTETGEFDSIDALVIIDADTTIDADLLRYFDKDLRAGRDWIQCYYTVSNPDDTLRTRLLTYAFSLYNGVMLLGQCVMGSSASFKGNGMCLSTRGLRRIPWRCHGLVEDMEYSWTLRLAGERILFESGASVYGMMVGSGQQAAVTQRRRWEFGRKETSRKFLGQFLRARNLTWWEKANSMIELSMPSMSWLAIVYVSVTVLNMAALRASATQVFPIIRGFIFAFPLFMTAALVTYAFAPFLTMRLPWRYGSSLAFFPFYFVWKIAVSHGGRPDQWIRTAREPVRVQPSDHGNAAPAVGKIPEEA